MLTAEFNMKTAHQVWKEMGIEEGMEKGWRDANIKTAQNLIREGFDVNKVAKFTELDTAIVEKLYDELHR